MEKIIDENLETRFAFLHAPWTENYRRREKVSKKKVSVSEEDLRQTVEILISNI